MRGTTVEFQVQTSNLAIVLAATSCPTKTNKAHEVTPPVPSQLEMCVCRGEASLADHWGPLHKKAGV